MQEKERYHRAQEWGRVEKGKKNSGDHE